MVCGGEPGLFPASNIREVKPMVHSRVKSVFVHAYIRTRFGRLEHVSAHFRSWPHQYTFNF
jgi:hypothetical protein